MIQIDCATVTCIELDWQEIHRNSEQTCRRSDRHAAFRRGLSSTVSNNDLETDSEPSPFEVTCYTTSQKSQLAEIDAVRLV